MAKRGRPPHPDILTPRQWEVLDCLRAGLSDQEIAGRLGISLDGAKCHVSEILGKLGVTYPYSSFTVEAFKVLP
jgi:DNA-binding NarL/FixJ family response regulator